MNTAPAREGTELPLLVYVWRSSITFLSPFFIFFFFFNRFVGSCFSYGRVHIRTILAALDRRPPPKATYTTASLGAKREADKIAGWIHKKIMTWDGQPGSANYITLFAYKLCFYRTPKYEYVETGNTTYSSISGRTKEKNTARVLDGRGKGNNNDMIFCC